MRKSLWAASVLALTVTVSSGLLLSGQVNAAETVQKLSGHLGFGGGGGGKDIIRTTFQNEELLKLLGVTEEELHTSLKSGKSLAELAGEKGVAVQKVIDLEVKLLTAELNQRLKDSKLTQSEYDAQKAKLAEVAKTLVNTTPKKHAFRKDMAPGHSPFEADVLTNSDIAKLLGLTQAELKTALQSGKSLSDLAAEKGVAVQKVIDLEAAAIKNSLAEQLKAGKLTQSEYDAALKNITTWASAVVNDKLIGSGSFGKGGGKLGKGGPIMLFKDDDLAKLLGLTADELAEALHSGKSLADLAGVKKVAVATVTAQVKKTLTADLDARLAEGQLTQAEYDTRKAELDTIAKDIVNGEFKRPAGGPGGGRGGHHGHHGHGGPFGGGPDEGAGSGTAAPDSSTTAPTNGDAV
ncbi:SHOCT domain-containing protein [Paenibacillus sp. GCM10023252]|uniref:SHOCT domain-containing protein n=1 Tax=Paenibacillus sp. GCM10023252 TaxID=3252649 RepID=UPI003618BAF7